MPAQLAPLSPFPAPSKPCLQYAMGASKPVFFCPTPLAASLCGGYVGGSATAEAGDGFIIVETNYRVGAYGGWAAAVACQLLPLAIGSAVDATAALPRETGSRPRSHSTPG